MVAEFRACAVAPAREYLAVRDLAWAMGHACMAGGHGSAKASRVMAGALFATAQARYQQRMGVDASGSGRRFSRPKRRVWVPYWVPLRERGAVL
jgi:hypothetical protein